MASNDYLLNLLMDPGLPLAAKTMLYKLYGIKPHHLEVALNSDNTQLRSAAYQHELCDQEFVEPYMTNPEKVKIISELIEQKPALYNSESLYDLYNTAFDWAETNPNDIGRLLQNVHNHPEFSQLDEEQLASIKPLATSDRGKSFGLDRFFPEEPEPNMPQQQSVILEQIASKPEKVVDQNGLVTPTTQYPNGSAPERLI